MNTAALVFRLSLRSLLFTGEAVRRNFVVNLGITSSFAGFLLRLGLTVGALGIFEALVPSVFVIGVLQALLCPTVLLTCSAELHASSFLARCVSRWL